MGTIANAQDFDGSDMRLNPTRNLDLLRSCAVLLVAFAHLFGNGLKWYGRGYTFPHSMGRLGVMIFFVHTALVLMMSMERMQLTGGSLLRVFYIRRAFRIYPLSIVTVIAVGLFHIPADPFVQFHRMSWSQLLSNLTLTQNVTRAPEAIGPLWSLPWEVQMYVALPFLYILVWKQRYKQLAAIVAGLIAANVIGLTVGVKAFRLLDYLPCFCAGVLAYGLLRLVKYRISGNLWPSVLAIGITVYLCSGFGWPVRNIFYRDWAVCLSVGLLVPFFADMSPGVSSIVAHFVAKYSYGIYLFHVPALWLAFDRLRWLGVPLSMLVFLGTTAALSVAGYHLIEEPMISYGKRMSLRQLRRGQALELAAALPS